MLDQMELALSEPGKLCRECGEFKEFDDFYARKGKGYALDCKPCYIEKVQANQRKNPLQTSDTAHKHYMKNRVEILAKDKTPERRAAYRKSYHDNKGNRLEKKRCKALVAVALRRGVDSDGNVFVREQCERCGAKDGIHGHHDDYRNPYDVMWLCSYHHGERHRELTIMRKTREGSEQPGRA